MLPLAFGVPNIMFRILTSPGYLVHDPQMLPPAGSKPPRQRLLTTSSGTNIDAFTWQDWALLAMIASIWGSSFILMEFGLESLAPGVITWLRIAMGAAALALVPRARRTRFAREDLPRTFFIGVIWMGIPLSLFPIAQQWIDSSVAGMINGGMPLTTAAWAMLMLRSYPPRRLTAGLLIGFVGMLAIFIPEVPLVGTGGDRYTAAGAGLVFLAIVLYGLAANLAVPLQQKYGSIPLMLRMQLAALVVVSPMGAVGLSSSTFTWRSVLAMIPLGVLCTGAAFVLMATLIGRVGGPRGSIAIYFVPVVAIILGVAALGEAVHVLAIAGTALVVVGAALTSRGERPKLPDQVLPH